MKKSGKVLRLLFGEFAEETVDFINKLKPLGEYLVEGVISAVSRELDEFANESPEEGTEQ